MVARVMISGTWQPMAEALAIVNNPGHADQKSHGRKGGFRRDRDIRAAFNYRDPKTGFQAKVIGIERDEGITEVEISIRDASGAEIGTAWRLIYDAKGDEPPYVVHDSMTLKPGTQGTGFGSRFNAHAEEAYRAQGMDRIELGANIDVGGYAWARAGYDFDPRADVHGGVKVRERFDSAVTDAKYAGIRDTVAALSARTGGPNPPTPAEWAMIGHTPGATMWPGKEIMLGSSWSAVKQL